MFVETSLWSAMCCVDWSPSHVHHNQTWDRADEVRTFCALFQLGVRPSLNFPLSPVEFSKNLKLATLVATIHYRIETGSTLQVAATSTSPSADHFICSDTLSRDALHIELFFTDVHRDVVSQLDRVWASVRGTPASFGWLQQHALPIGTNSAEDSHFSKGRSRY